VLFNNVICPGILTTQGWFAQKYGYFEIRAKVPIGDRGVAGILAVGRMTAAGRPRSTSSKAAASGPAIS